MLRKLAFSLVCVIAFLSVSGAEVVLNYPDAVGKAAGSNLRGMTYNILIANAPEGPWPMKDRAAGMIEIINKIQPDFAGFQEVDPIWFSLLADKIAPWKFARNPYDDNMCAIIYNSSKFRQIDGGVYALTNKAELKIRCLRWTLLENIRNGKKFIVTNTHWFVDSPRRTKNAAVMTGYLKMLVKRFPGIPFFCTGDFNSQLEYKEFSDMMKAVGFKDSVASAAVTENRKFGSSFNTKNKKLFTDRSHVDHIIVSGNVKVLSAKLFVGGTLFTTSDHLPVVADFEI